MATLEKAPTSNFWSTSLNGAINDSVTTITLNSTTGLQAPGRLVINRQDSTGKNTPSAREVISFTGISGSDLTGVTRGADNSTARSHADGSLVESAMVVGNWDALYKVIDQEHNADGTHDTSKVAGVDGWVNSDETWTREGDNSFSEPIDATLKYQKGDKIRYKQGGGWKYQYIIGVGAYSGGKTIMTTYGGSDYKFDSGTAITDNYYSHQANPIGFPAYFSYTPYFILVSGTGTVPTFSAAQAFLSLNGKLATLQFNLSNITGGTAGSGTGEVGLYIPLTVGGMTHGFVTTTTFANGGIHKTIFLWANGVLRSNTFVGVTCDEFNDPTRYISGAMSFYI